MGHFSTERKHSWWPQAAHLHRLCSNQLALFISGWCRFWVGRGEAPTLSQRWVAGFPYVISCALASNTKGDVSSPQFHKRTLGRGDVTWLVQGHPAIRGQAGDFVSWMKRVKAMGCLLLETTSQVDQWAHNFRQGFGSVSLCVRKPDSLPGGLNLIYGFSASQTILASILLVIKVDGCAHTFSRSGYWALLGQRPRLIL